MKKIYTLLIFCFASVLSYSQQNLLSVEGGYALADIENTSANASGWRISGLYEFNRYEGKFTQGISAGYVSLSADVQEGKSTSKYTIGTLPVYYAPGVLFGKDKLKVHLKAAIGWQWSNIERTGSALGLEGNDSGITLGAGLGGVYQISPSLFMNLGYEFLFLQNSYLSEGYLNTIKIGFGCRF